MVYFGSWLTQKAELLMADEHLVLLCFFSVDLIFPTFQKIRVYLYLIFHWVLVEFCFFLENSYMWTVPLKPVAL